MSPLIANARRESKFRQRRFHDNGVEEFLASVDQPEIADVFKDGAL
jgi:hypothetical protein